MKSKSKGRNQKSKIKNIVPPSALTVAAQVLIFDF
jgi:hypothetical protein